MRVPRRLLVLAAVIPVALLSGAVATDGSVGIAAAVAAPNTQIHGGPYGTTTSRTARFHLFATAPARIYCKLDRRAWRLCSSDRSGYVTFRYLRAGSHTIYARAVNRSGRDATPARRTWRIR